jgi:hypothetical protein
VLFSLLSGFRSARSPLIVGYVVLMALWLLLFDLLPASSASLRDEYPEIEHIFSIVGAVGVFAAFSFAAYLIGDLVVRETGRLLQIRGQGQIPVEASTSQTRQFLRKVFSVTHDAEMDELEERLDEMVDRAMMDGTEVVDLDRLRAELGEKISTKQGRNLKGFRILSPDEADLSPLALNIQVRVEAKSGRIDERILAQNPELFSELSRLRGEAEFRAALLPALMLLFIAIAVRVSWPWWLLGVIGAGLAMFEYLTLMDVFQLRSRARGIALRAVLDELVSTPTLDAIKRESEVLRRPQWTSDSTF